MTKHKATKQPEWLRNRQEVADFLGVSRMTIHRWEKFERLSVPLGWGPTRYIKRDRVDEWYWKLKNNHKIRNLYRDNVP